MSSKRYIVWIKSRFNERGHWVEDPIWEEQGDGPMGPKTAERVAREIAHDFGCRTMVLPVGKMPPELAQKRETFLGVHMRDNKHPYLKD